MYTKLEKHKLFESLKSLKAKFSIYYVIIYTLPTHLSKMYIIGFFLCNKIFFHYFQ